MFQSVSVHFVFRLFVLFLRFSILNFQFSILTSCSFGDEPAICPYNTRLEYWYAGSGTQNMLPTYVDNLRQYLFDADGQLISTVTLRGDSISGWQGELEDGTYTFVLWGNLGDVNEQIVTTKSDMNISEMTLSAEQQGTPPGYRGNTDRLYYGNATVEVKNGAAQRQRVYLSHAHAALNISVRWMTDRPLDGTFRMRLKGIPALYSFSGDEANTVPSGDGTYSLPFIGNKVTYHETRASMNYEGEVIGEFVTFRYTSSTHQLWSLWRDGQQIVKDLDLNLFFKKLPMDMDTNMEQEFDLLVTVYEDRIVVTQATAADWDEGGAIG